MTEPVKLSRERWEMLWRDAKDAQAHMPGDRINLYEPREIDGITFLPATYVPRDAIA